MYVAAPHMGVSHRQCLVEIQNKSPKWSLTNPLVHLVSGSSEAPLPPTLKPSEAGSARFSKSFGLRGSVGVFTYDLVHVYTKRVQGKMAVMFSVPYDFSLYSNWYAIGMFDEDQPCDKDLYELMYKGGEEGFVRGRANGPGLTHRTDQVTVRATMSDGYRPVLKVDICYN